MGRYALFGAALAVLAAALAPAARRLDRDPALRPGRLAALCAIVLAAFAVQHALSPPFDDESMRLVAVVSLLSDGDLDLADEYRDEAWRAFRGPGPSYFTDFAAKVRAALEREARTFYPYHAPGFVFLLLPGFALGAPLGAAAARLGAALPVLAAAAALPALLARVLVEEGVAVRDARRLAAAFALAAPSLFFGVHLWPEPVAALGGLWAFRAIRRPGGRALDAALGALLAGLPLLHFRYAFLSAPLLLLAAWAGRRRPGRLAAIALGAAAPAAAVLALYAVRSDPATWSVLVEIRYETPAGLGRPDFLVPTWREVIERTLLPPAGIVPYLPLLLAVRGGGLACRWPALLAASGIVAQTLAYGLASGPLGRFWTPALPLLLLAALGSPRPGRLAAALASFGAAKGLLLVAVPALCHDARYQIGWIAEAGPLAPLLLFLLA